MNVIYGHDEAVAEWVKQRTPYVVNGFGESTAIGVADSDLLLAGIVYHEWRPAYRSMQVSIASEGKRWCSRRIMKSFYAYPFIQMGCKRITAMVAADNNDSIDFVTRLGFQLEGNLRMGCGDIDCLVFGQLRGEAMQWIG